MQKNFEELLRVAREISQDETITEPTEVKEALNYKGQIFFFYLPAVRGTQYGLDTVTESELPFLIQKALPKRHELYAWLPWGENGGWLAQTQISNKQQYQ